ncbi:MAG: ThuA domain-containing protein [Planctomycetes bacterium]|nr:ThuA domain-containing protein [Planctomycetota bacterium]
MIAALVATLGMVSLVSANAAAQSTPAHVLIVVGPSKHPPGSHEVLASAKLVKHCLEHADNVRGITAEVVTTWPTDSQLLDRVASVVFSGDRFPGEEMPERDRIMADLPRMMDRCCGLVCYHYATGLTAKHVKPDGDHPLLRWMGGYFATGCPHHKSVAKVFNCAIDPGTGDHPVLRGWKSFSLRDEPYYNNYFGPNGPMPNVTALATSMLPPEEPKRETVAWAVSRADGGRGVGVVMPHFYRNWHDDNLRTLILNGVVWSAKVDVPSDGVRVTLPDLATFEPGAVEPQVKKTP